MQSKYYHNHDRLARSLEELLRIQLQHESSPRNIFIALMAMLATLRDTEDTEQNIAVFSLASKLVSRERTAIGVSLLKSAASSLIECIWEGLTQTQFISHSKEFIFSGVPNAESPSFMMTSNSSTQRASPPKNINEDAIMALGYLLSIVAPSKFYLFFEQALQVDQKLLVYITEHALKHISTGSCKDKLITILLKRSKLLSPQLIRTLVKGYSTLSACSSIILMADPDDNEKCQQETAQLVVGTLISVAVFIDSDSTDFFLSSIVPFSKRLILHRRIQLLSLLQTLRFGTNALITWLIQSIFKDTEEMENDNEGESLSLVVQALMRSIFIDRGDCDPAPLLGPFTTKLKIAKFMERNDLLRVITLLVNNFLSQAKCASISQSLIADLEGSIKTSMIYNDPCTVSWDLLAILSVKSSNALQFLLDNAMSHNSTIRKISLRALENVITSDKNDDSHHLQLSRILLATPPSKLTYRMLEKILTPTLVEHGEPKILEMIVLGLKERSSSARLCAARMLKALLSAEITHSGSMEHLLDRIAAGLLVSTHSLSRAAFLKALTIVVGFMTISVEDPLNMSSPDDKTWKMASISSSVACLARLQQMLDSIKLETRAEMEGATLLLTAIFKKTPSRRLVGRIFALSPVPLLRSFVSFLLKHGMENLVPTDQRRFVAAVRKARSRASRKKNLPYSAPKENDDASEEQYDDTSENDQQSEDEFNHEGLVPFMEHQTTVDYLPAAAQEKNNNLPIEQPKQYVASALEKRRKHRHASALSSVKIALQPYSYIPLSKKILGAHKCSKKRHALLFC